MKTVTLYTYDHCPYCDAAKALMKSRSIPFEETRVSRSNADLIQQLAKRSGMRTFPQIWVGETLIGGYTDMERLDREGKLMDLVK